MLRERGAAEVIVAPAYKTVAPSGAALDRMRQALSVSGYDLIAFTSSSTASNFVEIAGKPSPATKAAAIGPITAATALELGFDIVVQPREYTIPALVEAIRDYFASTRRSD
jgi:uroporphyrinogen III methyltransferase/synthase